MGQSFSDRYRQFASGTRSSDSSGTASYSEPSLISQDSKPSTADSIDHDNNQHSKDNDRRGVAMDGEIKSGSDRDLTNVLASGRTDMSQLLQLPARSWATFVKAPKALKSDPHKNEVMRVMQSRSPDSERSTPSFCTTRTSLSLSSMHDIPDVPSCAETGNKASQPVPDEAHHRTRVSSPALSKATSASTYTHDDISANESQKIAPMPAPQPQPNDCKQPGRKLPGAPSAMPTPRPSLTGKRKTTPMRKRRIKSSRASQAPTSAVPIAAFDVNIPVREARPAYQMKGDDPPFKLSSIAQKAISAASSPVAPLCNRSSDSPTPPITPNPTIPKSDDLSLYPSTSYLSPTKVKQDKKETVKNKLHQQQNIGEDDIISRRSSGKKGGRLAAAAASTTTSTAHGSGDVSSFSSLSDVAIISSPNPDDWICLFCQYEIFCADMKKAQRKRAAARRQRHTDQQERRQITEEEERLASYSTHSSAAAAAAAAAAKGI
ncbi:hypothetical protein BCR43DRAFT_498535 [Syncephalastrum racemosum]|uniref:Uncharacterized protein n=1 Tax=Syncephalastrum racemosum TaxID=13706 RepID=A0A1X2H112_SYNRA|nr:hypothetical protein BCR43DRAFT_498535 [Syncephalastrum racemosum]